jgi:hypothetical protein
VIPSVSTRPTYEALEPPGDPGQSLFVYMAEPNPPSQEALDLFASWSATSPEDSMLRLSKRPELSTAS